MSFDADILDLSPTGRLTRETRTFRTAEEKAAWLVLDVQREADSLVLRPIGAMFRAAYPDPNARAAAIHRWVRDTFRYRRDPRDGAGRPREEYARVAVILSRREDDCDGKARLFVATCLASGVLARIHPVFRGPGNFVHVIADVWYLGRWRVAELIVAGVDIGGDASQGQRDAAGRLVMAGP